MSNLQAVIDALNARKNKVLLFAEAALPASQFRAFKRLFLDEFGQRGLETELERILAEGNQLDRRGMGGNIHAGKEVPE